MVFYSSTITTIHGPTNIRFTQTFSQDQVLNISFRILFTLFSGPFNIRYPNIFLSSCSQIFSPASFSHVPFSIPFLNLYWHSLLHISLSIPFSCTSSVTFPQIILLLPVLKHISIYFPLQLLLKYLLQHPFLQYFPRVVALSIFSSILFLY